MKKVFGILGCGLAVLLTGCFSPPPPPTSLANEPSAAATRDNSYALLHQLCDDQKGLSLLRFVKHERPDIKNLTKEIAADAKADEKELEKFARENPPIDLGAIQLPPGETATRDAIAKTKEKDLLDRKGNDLDLTLLLTQTDALSYGWHLAGVAAAADPNPQRARALQDIARQQEDLYQQVYDLIRAQPDTPAK